jgi:hypothetical protein
MGNMRMKRPSKRCISLSSFPQELRQKLRWFGSRHVLAGRKLYFRVLIPKGD